MMQHLFDKIDHALLKLLHEATQNSSHGKRDLLWSLLSGLFKDPAVISRVSETLADQVLEALHKLRDT